MFLIDDDGIGTGGSNRLNDAYMDAHKATRLRKPCLQCHCHSFSFAGCGGLF